MAKGMELRASSMSDAREMSTCDPGYVLGACATDSCPTKFATSNSREEWWFRDGPSIISEDLKSVEANPSEMTHESAIGSSGIWKQAMHLTRGDACASGTFHRRRLAAAAVEPLRETENTELEDAERSFAQPVDLIGLPRISMFSIRDSRDGPLEGQDMLIGNSMDEASRASGSTEPQSRWANQAPEEQPTGIYRDASHTMFGLALLDTLTTGSATTGPAGTFAADAVRHPLQRLSGLVENPACEARGSGDAQSVSDDQPEFSEEAAASDAAISEEVLAIGCSVKSQEEPRQAAGRAPEGGEEAPWLTEDRLSSRCCWNNF